MQTIAHKIDGDVVLEEDTILRGMIAGSVTVPKDTVLHLHGTVTGSVFLQEGSAVFLHGTVAHDVVNDGGHLEIDGIVQGQVVRARGETLIHPVAMIEGGVV